MPKKRKFNRGTRVVIVDSGREGIEEHAYHGWLATYVGKADKKSEFDHVVAIAHALGDARIVLFHDDEIKYEWEV